MTETDADAVARSTVHGPYDSRTQAFADAAPLNDALRAADPGPGPMTDEIRAARLRVRVEYLTGALVDAGVEMGEYDKRIAAWLADWETETLQVLVGWIERAAAGHRAASPDAPAETTAQLVPKPQVTHHAVMRGGIAETECGTRRFWELATRAWKDVTCPDCLTALDDGDGGAA
jgi:hypothetical protein